MAAATDQALQWVDRLYKELGRRRPEIERNFNYFRGKQPLTYATPQWRKFHQDRYQKFSDNWCGVVGRSPVDRLRIDGIRIGDDPSVRDEAEKALWDDWRRNEMGTQSKQGFLASTIAKRSAVIVWGDTDENPVATWEHPSQVVVAYSASNRRIRLAALKCWVEDDMECATLYLPDALWKFQRASSVAIRNGRTPAGLHVSGSIGAGGWQPRQPADDDTWPIANMLGEVPVVEFANRPMLDGEPLSDIEGTIAMQDAINLLWAYLFTAADHASMPARVVLGAEPPKVPILDENGQVIGSKPAVLEDLAEGRLLFLPGIGDSARIGQWDAAKLDVFTNTITQAVSHIAAQTSTPGHYLVLSEKFANLNGDALTAAETPLAMKVIAEQEFYAPDARDVFRLMAKVRGNDALAEQVRLSTILWKDAEMHSLAQVADAATKDRAVGMSLASVLERRYGMNQAEIDRELARIDEEQASGLIGNLLRPTAPPTAGTSGAPVGP